MIATFTIYSKNQREHPGKFVVRRWTMDKIGALRTDEPPFALADSLSEARKTIPSGLFRFKRNDEDDPSILETWI